MAPGQPCKDDNLERKNCYEQQASTDATPAGQQSVVNARKQALARALSRHSRAFLGGDIIQPCVFSQDCCLG